MFFYIYHNNQEEYIYIDNLSIFSLSLSISSNGYLDQLKSMKATAIQACIKRKSKASSVLNMIHEFENNQLSISDTNNTDGKPGTWFQNQSANESNSEIEQNRYSNKNENEKEENQEKEKSKIPQLK